MSENLVDFCYLLAACLFIVGVKCLSSPKTAPRGNLTAALGMLVAVVAAQWGPSAPGGAYRQDWANATNRTWSST